MVRSKNRCHAGLRLYAPPSCSAVAFWEGPTAQALDLAIQGLLGSGLASHLLFLVVDEPETVTCSRAVR